MRDEMMVGVKAGMEALKDLDKLLGPGGLREQERVQREMEDMISPEYEPYFSANAALHILAKCERCGRCCLEEKTIAVSIEDCRRIARYLGLSSKRFIMDFTRPHELKAENVGSARLLRKDEGAACPLFDPSLPGCTVHSVKPQVCRAAFYLSKMNLLICEEHKRIGPIPGCPADARLREMIADFRRILDCEPGAMKELEAFFSSDRRDAELFRLLLRLKGFERYFGTGRAWLLARRLGFMRMPDDEEMRPALWLYAAAMSNLLFRGLKSRE
ncbi:MAG: YkgJ family cysteine cluster protein [Methanothrix sp.]|nr:YkgJ family cysteine cluster protein [Methanothrix sp.]